MAYDISALPYSILAGSIFIIVLVSAVAKLYNGRKVLFALSSAALIAVVLASYFLFLSGSNTVFLNIFRVYPFSDLFGMLIASLLLLVNIQAFGASGDYNAFLSLFGFASLGMFAVVFASSLLAIFLGIEAMMIATAFMIIIEHRHHVEAAIKLFLMGSVAAAVFAFAIALLLPYDPALSLAAIPGLSGAGKYLISLSLFLIAASLSFEAGIFPFNLWIPDVYEGSPGYMTPMLAGINKKVAFVAMISILFITFGYYVHLFPLLFVVLSAATMLFGNLLALVQDNVKRMLAYSSISQAGYIMVGIAVATQYGIESSIFQIFAHAFMVVGAFSIVAWLESRNIKTVGDYAGLASRNWIASLSLTLFMLSMAGIPPLIGFDGKFLLFTSAAYAGMLPLAFFGVINSFISMYYYWKVISSVYSERHKEKLRLTRSVAFSVAVALFMVVIVGIYPLPLISLAGEASRSLLALV